MTLEELKQKIDRIYGPATKDCAVVVTLDQFSAGPRASVPVEWVHRGSDWERDQIRVECARPVIDKENGRDIPKRKAKGSGNDAFVCPSCGDFVDRHDSYCCRCGQNISLAE